MTPLLFNLLFGLIPTMAFAWSLAADERKDEAERVVVTAQDERRHHQVFALVYGLWSATLAMWNWMSGYHRGWIALWLAAFMAAFAIWARNRRSRRSGS